jgi:hypothetical protein
VMRGKVRQAYRYFLADFDTMQHFIDLADEGAGGPNDFTNRARNAVKFAKRAVHDCLLHFANGRNLRARAAAVIIRTTPKGCGT